LGTHYFGIPEGLQGEDGGPGKEKTNEFRSVAQIREGGFILAGTTTSFSIGTSQSDLITPSDIWLQKVNAKGEVLWTKPRRFGGIYRTFGGGSWDYGYAVKQLNFLGGSSKSEKQQEAIKNQSGFAFAGCGTVTIDPPVLGVIDSEGHPRNEDQLPVRMP
jgi:hypothetical protein